jgi:hypothetical protein
MAKKKSVENDKNNDWSSFYVPGTSSQLSRDHDPIFEPNAPKIYTPLRTGNLKLSIHIPRTSYLHTGNFCDCAQAKPHHEKRKPMRRKNKVCRLQERELLAGPPPNFISMLLPRCCSSICSHHPPDPIHDVELQFLPAWLP